MAYELLDGRSPSVFHGCSLADLEARIGPPDEVVNVFSSTSGFRYTAHRWFYAREGRWFGFETGMVCVGSSMGNKPHPGPAECIVEKSWTFESEASMRNAIRSWRRTF